MISKESVRIFKLMSGEFAIASEEGELYKHLHFLNVVPTQNKKSMSPQFIPFGIPIYANDDVSAEIKEFDEKIFMDFTDVKSELADFIKDLFAKEMTKQSSGIILPDSGIVGV